MSSTHPQGLNEVKASLERLSKLDVDFLNDEQNRNIASSIEKTVELASEFLKDCSKEEALLASLMDSRRSIERGFNERLQGERNDCLELEKKLEVEGRANRDAKTRLKKSQNTFSGGDFEVLMGRQEMVDRLRQWRHSCDLERVEIKNLTCKIDILQEKINAHQTHSNQFKSNNRLFYELLCSALKVTVTSVEETVNVAVLSEARQGSEQTWHRMSFAKEADVETSDFLWRVIGNSLSHTGQEREINTPKVNTIHLSSH